MGYKVYSNEFRAQVVEFYKTHTVADTVREFNVGKSTLANWCIELGFSKGCSNFKDDFKHEVCQYYDNHTWYETCEKFAVSNATLCQWRRELGYRNKSRGYNLYMEYLQPTMQKRQSRDIVMTKMENGDLKGKVAVLEDRLKDATYLLQQVLEDLNGKDLM